LQQNNLTPASLLLAVFCKLRWEGREGRHGSTCQKPCFVRPCCFSKPHHPLASILQGRRKNGFVVPGSFPLLPPAPPPLYFPFSVALLFKKKKETTEMTGETKTVCARCGCAWEKKCVNEHGRESYCICSARAQGQKIAGFSMRSTGQQL
jgi:hypothetical protein